MAQHKIWTRAELAELLHVSAMAVTKWMQSEEWCFGKPPWPRRFITEISEWRKDRDAYVWGRKTPEEQRRIRKGIAAEYLKYGLMTEAEAKRYVTYGSRG